jgi:hypothetical protein
VALLKLARGCSRAPTQRLKHAQAARAALSRLWATSSGASLNSSGKSYGRMRFVIHSPRGMQVDAEIALGERTVLEYILSPVRKAFHAAARQG